MDEARAEEEAGSVTMRVQWLFNNENVPVNCESSLLSVCVEEGTFHAHFLSCCFFMGFALLLQAPCAGRHVLSTCSNITCCSGTI